jgi:hypothetical protein
VRADKRDAEFWLSQANMDAAPEGAKDFFKARWPRSTRTSRRASSSRSTAAAELAPGIKAVPDVRHTKGHTIYLVESKGQKLAVLAT